MSDLISLTVISKNFRARRKSLRVTQQEIATALHRDPKYVGRVERGKTSILLEDSPVIEDQLKLSSVKDLCVPNKFYAD